MSPKILLPCPLKDETSIHAADYDGVLLVIHCVKELSAYKQTQDLAGPVSEYVKLNKGVGNAGCGAVISVPKTVVPSGRLVLSFTGPVTRDYDDVRRFTEAAKHGIKVALSAGMRSPLLVTLPHKLYENAELCAVTGAFHSLHVPLNVREEEKKQKADKLGVLPLALDAKWLVKIATAFESGCTVARDVGASDPERMTAPRVAEYIEQAFEGGCVKVKVVSDQDYLSREFPMMMHVNRAASQNPRHPARLIWLEYVPAGGKVDKTLMMVGKGVTLDTGGTDLKVLGIMKGMSQDKYGSAGVGGFMKVIELLQPKGLKVMAAMAMVRNSIGSHSYTCDEILTCRSGKRIRIANTDAEGRITMLDPLTFFREIAPKEINPHAFTVATLTGHALLAKGFYPTVLDNGPALQDRECYTLQEASTKFGQPFDISIFRHEDFNYHAANEEAAEILQTGQLSTAQTKRGHMTPGAFMQIASRFDEHGLHSEQPIKFSHVDIGSAQGAFPEITNGCPLIAFAAKYVIPRI